MKERTILHCDLNNFYASVECFYNPEIRGLPVVVCGDEEKRHGIVLAKNYIAKSYGIVTGDVLWQARQKCPGLVAIKADFKKYLRYSDMARKIYRDYAFRIESFGIDECWLDVTGDDGKAIADEIRARIRSEMGVTASVGVSWNKIYAKLGSDMKKPDATTVITKENYKDTVYPLAVENLLMVGRATTQKLNRYGVRTIGQLAMQNVDTMKRRFGKVGEMLWRYANGFDDSEVKLDGQKDKPKSVSNSVTTPRDLNNIAQVRLLVTLLSESVALRLREEGLKANVVSLYIRDCNLKGWGKQKKLMRPSMLSEDFIEGAMALFKEYEFVQPIRAVGVSVSMLVEKNSIFQRDFFISPEELQKKEKLEKVIYDIKNHYGNEAICRAIKFTDKQLAEAADKTHGFLP